MEYEYLHPSQDPKYKFRKFHVLVEPFAYRQDEDDRIINDLLKFTNKQIQKDTEFQITFNQWATADNQNIMATMIQPGLMVGYHSHDFYEMCYSFTDKIYQYINGDIIILNKGDVLLMHPDTRHSLCPNPCAAATNIHISKQYAKTLSEKLLTMYSDNSFSYVVNKKSYIIIHTNNEELDKLISEIAQFNYEELRNNKLLNFYLEANFDQMVAKLLMEEKYGKSISLVNGLSRQRENNIEEIISYINTNYAFVDADMVCKRFHYSRMQLYRLLKKTTGMSFIDYISELRFLHAKFMLLESDIPIKKIAENIGLDEQYFYRFFQGYTGKTPRDFRLENRVADKDA